MYHSSWECTKNLTFFNQQGLETYNDEGSKDFIRSTNHRDLEALPQMMLKQNCIEFLEVKDEGCISLQKLQCKWA